MTTEPLECGDGREGEWRMNNKHNMTLKEQMVYAGFVLENIMKYPQLFGDGLFYEKAKPTLPSKCTRCGYRSYCDAVWIRSTEHDMPPLIMRSCPCGQSVIEARPKGEKPYIVTDLTDDVVKGQS